MALIKFPNFDAVNQHFAGKLAAGTASGAATGTAIAPTYVYGEFLNTNGIWLLSYGEWLRVLGGLGVLVMIINVIWRWKK